ncbi:type II toxin-antitoxin system VapC family toxin [Methylovirgula sp. HY1]|uniref:type II toxin-antitoxin system VapC family toxin n=1 Tax=Methylovirgula sp. HY1 TaxID=2822761 RepID=UPI001C5B2910|nr:type II toxin-antitoxin system VapC family toxin [Methylovirgula sp. HY1]QXX76179.1 tRNA(fMet)-specific endonuclease VapC [Methylovirgula sp. HY1]
MICLDTNAVIAVINGRTPAVRVHLEAALSAGQQVAVPVIVLFELWFGIVKSLRVAANKRALSVFFANGVEILPFDADDAREAGDIRGVLARAGSPIGAYDILIAAQARRRDALLVTANGREFVRVPGLRTEDWAAPSGQ